MAPQSPSRLARFRPCIDLHQGVVKQIVGATLSDDGPAPVENFVAQHPPAWFANQFRIDGLHGGHVIKLGPGNDAAAREALATWPGGLQLGGGINADNASEWIDAGASHVIVTSALFSPTGMFLQDSLNALVRAVGKQRLVIDLSCRRSPHGWTVAMNRWQTLTQTHLSEESLDHLAKFCDEFLIHAADVEGLCRGIDPELVEFLGDWGKIPVTYAGGAACWNDLDLIQSLGRGNVDVTIGSALDLFGGSGFPYHELLVWNQRAC